MTQEEWATCEDPKRMAEFMDGRASDRKYRLFATACCRFAWEAITDARSREAIVVAEQLAETGGVLSHIQHPIGRASFDACDDAPEGSPPQKGAAAANILLTSREWGSGERYPNGSSGVTAALLMYVNWAIAIPAPGALPRQASLFRCVVGDPFRPVTLARAHRTPAVASLARAAYDERHLPSGELNVDRLMVLADALEEAGAPAELTEHLRGGGPHVRGCHVVDLCLGLS
jgi:hypothetical protein